MNEYEEDMGAQIKYLFEGCVPERIYELQNLWEKYDFKFTIRNDGDVNRGIILQASSITGVICNYRILWAIWVSGFIMWESYSITHSAANLKEIPLSKINQYLDFFDKILKVSDLRTLNIPKGISDFGHYSDIPELRAPSELATFAVGWVMLHEIKHIELSKGDTTATSEHEEELECDAYATKFMLEKAVLYAEKHVTQSSSKVLCKRQAGIYCALFAMALLSKNNYDVSNSHPPLEERYKNIRKILLQDKEQLFAKAFACASFIGMKQALSDFPLIIK